MGFFSRKKKDVVVGQLIPPPPKTFRYYRDPLREDETVGPGLQIEVVANSEFQQQTIDTLDAIYNTDTGRLVIDALATSGKSIRITKATLGNSCDVGPDGLCAVAAEMYLGAVGLGTNNALDACSDHYQRTRQTKYQWLADRINSTPFYKLKGVPSTAAFDVGITAAQVQAWLERREQLERGGWTADQQNHIVNSVITALQGRSAAGVGSNAAIGFNPNPTFVLNTERPAGIGLAHELIHAFWSVRGEQCGWTIEHPTTVLFEHKCVGLGFWEHDANEAQVCENQIRQEWFAATAGLFDGTDHVNRSSPARRDYYSA